MIQRFVTFGLVVMLGAACGASKTTVDVFAASSLTDAFTELEERFEAENPGVDIRLNLAGSDTLRRQIDDGAEAHVFAPADLDLFDGLDVDPTPYATNELTVVLSTNASIQGRPIEQALFAGLLVARCATGVPCGDATERLISSQGLDLSGSTVTAESDVRAVLSKVILGEVDVGFVYRTDVIAGGDQVIETGITSPDATVTLALATLAPRDSSNAAVAADFAAFVLSAQAAELFSSLGFDPAP